MANMKVASIPSYTGLTKEIHAPLYIINSEVTLAANKEYVFAGGIKIETGGKLIIRGSSPTILSFYRGVGIELAGGQLDIQGTTMYPIWFRVSPDDPAQIAIGFPAVESSWLGVKITSNMTLPSILKHFVFQHATYLYMITSGVTVAIVSDYLTTSYAQFDQTASILVAGISSAPTTASITINFDKIRFHGRSGAGKSVFESTYCSGDFTVTINTSLFNLEALSRLWSFRSTTAVSNTVTCNNCLIFAKSKYSSMSANYIVMPVTGTPTVLVSIYFINCFLTEDPRIAMAYGSKTKVYITGCCFAHIALGALYPASSNNNANGTFISSNSDYVDCGVGAFQSYVNYGLKISSVGDFISGEYGYPLDRVNMDKSGNTTRTTPSAIPNVHILDVTDPEVSDVEQTTATISWTTGVICRTSFSIRESSGDTFYFVNTDQDFEGFVGGEELDTKITETHTVRLTQLKPDTEYSLQAFCNCPCYNQNNATDFEESSSIVTFTTDAIPPEPEPEIPMYEILDPSSEATITINLETFDEDPYEIDMDFFTDYIKVYYLKHCSEYFEEKLLIPDNFSSTDTAGEYEIIFSAEELNSIGPFVFICSPQQEDTFMQKVYLNKVSTSVETCLVRFDLKDLMGAVAAGQKISIYSLYPVVNYETKTIANFPIHTTTNNAGITYIAITRGLQVRVVIQEIGFSADIEIPDSESAEFTDLRQDKESINV